MVGLEVVPLIEKSRHTTPTKESFANRNGFISELSQPNVLGTTPFIVLIRLWVIQDETKYVRIPVDYFRAL